MIKIKRRVLEAFSFKYGLIYYKNTLKWLKKIVPKVNKFGITGFRVEKYSFVKSFRKQINIVPLITKTSV